MASLHLRALAPLAAAAILSWSPAQAPVPLPPPQNTATLPTFDAASVKLTDTTAPPRMTYSVTPGRYTCLACPAGYVFTNAFHLPDGWVIGLPDWTQNNTRFDFQATMPLTTPNDQLRLMLQSLLADRFQLRYHWELRTLETTVMEVVKGGSKLRPANPGDCFKAEFYTQVPPGQTRCGGIAQTLEREGNNSYLVISGRSISMPALAEVLSRSGSTAAHGVVDRTGLKGEFDFDVKIGPSMPPDFADYAPGDDRNQYVRAYSLATYRDAFRLQAGLLLDPGALKKTPVPVMVIDRMTPPTAN